MRVLGYLLLAIACVALGLGTFVYIAAPVELVRDQIVATVKRETGRDLLIRGSTSFAIYPKLGISLGDVELSAPPEMGGAPFLKMASLKLAMPLGALLQRKISIDEFILVDPRVDLRIDRDGRKSWSFDIGSEPQRSSTGEAGQALSPELEEFIQNSSRNQDTSERDSVSAGISGLRLGDVRIINGSLHYSDVRNGTSETITSVDVTVGLDDLRAPLTVSGDGIWKGANVPVEMKLASLHDVLAGQRAKMQLKMTTSSVKLAFDGVVDPAGEGAVAGKLNLATEDVPGIATWVSGNRDAAGPLQRVSMEGTLKGDRNSIVLQQASFTLNDLKGQGDLAMRLADRAAIEGNVRVGAIRTASFLGAAGAPAASGGDGQAASQRPRTTDWDSKPINFKALRSADVKMNVAFDSLTHGDISVGAGKMAIALDRGLLRLNSDRLSVYNGTVRSTVVIDARPAVALYSAQIAADGVSALPLLKALADFDWLSGVTTAQIDIKGRGLSQRQMMRTMDGTAALNFVDGAVEGLNVAKILRGIQQGQFDNFDRVPGEKTDFSSLSASFNVVSGIATNNDLKLVGPLVRASGAGTINIGGRTIDYRLIPKLVASLEGQGGSDLSGLTIPVKIRGAWSKPRIAPDLNGILENPEEAVKNLGGLVEGARKKIKSRRVNDFLDNVLGGEQPSGGEEKKKPLGGLLGDLLQQ